MPDARRPAAILVHRGKIVEMMKYSKQKTEITLRSVVLVLVSLLIMSCVACTSSTIEGEDPATSGFTESALGTSSEKIYLTSVSEEKSTEPTDSEPTAESTATEETSSGTSTSGTTTQSPASRTAKTTTSRVTKTTRRVTTATTSTRRTTPPSTTVSDKITVTIVVECRNAVLRKKEFPGLEDKINYMIERKMCSADGHMLKRTAAFPRDTTVYDALLSLPLDIKVSSFNPGYIVAIGGLAEKEGGPGSGWVYLVNGIFVMKGSTQCVLNDGDVVHWGYTIERGDVK